MVERINSTEHLESPDPESETARASFASKESDETTQTLPNGVAPAAFSTILLDDRFRIIREIARGGIGIAYLASDSQAQDRLVVIKALLEQPDPRHKSWVERHFREEVKALSRIDHPGIVKLVTSGELADGRPFIAMEFVEGSTLRSHIEPEVGLGDPIRIANFIRKVGQAISAAHDAGNRLRYLHCQGRAGREDAINIGGRQRTLYVA
jgi:serine/threonine-protein kinase